MRLIPLFLMLFFLTACGGKAEADSQTSAPQETIPASSVGVAQQPNYGPSGTYKNDKAHAYISFSYSHKGLSNPLLRWRNWDATLNWDGDDPTRSTLTVIIQAASIDSGVDEFDGHLRSPRFFDVEAYPEIRFVSTKAEKIEPNRGRLTGDLTLKGQTRPVTLDVTFNKAAEGGEPGTGVLGFSARTMLKRSEWDLGYAVPFVGDAVDIIIEAEFGSQ